MRTSLTRAGLMAAVAGLVVGTAACSSDSGPQDMGPADTAAGAETAGGPRADSDAGDGADGSDGENADQVVVEEQPGEPPRTIDAGEGDYEFGLGRDSISETIETTYEDENASVVWEGDTMVVAMDGDADATMAGFSECRVITAFVLEDDSVAILFPNGRVECAEVMGG